MNSVSRRSRRRARKVAHLWPDDQHSRAWYSLPSVLRTAWFQSDGRGVWPSMEPRSVFRAKVATPNKGRGVWDFTYNPESGWLWRWAQACSFVFVRTTVPTLKHAVFCQSGNQKKRAWRHVTQEEGSTSCKMRKSQMEAELHGLVVGESEAIKYLEEVPFEKYVRKTLAIFWV